MQVGWSPLEHDTECPKQLIRLTNDITEIWRDKKYMADTGTFGIKGKEGNDKSHIKFEGSNQ